MQPLAPGDPERIGPYRTIAELGHGAMGRVFLASAPDGRPVAVKLIASTLAGDEEFRARFRREVAASKQVAGAYTAAVLEAGPDDEVPWLASEFLIGPNLKDVVEASGPLPEPTLLRLAAGLASALAAIHAAGMVHRDLKPANVILAADGPRVIDFGIARAADGLADNALTQAGNVIGTPDFMSPEQAESGTVSAASDIFSLGAVLVVAATGRSPFTGSSTLETLNNVVRSQPDLSGLSPRIRAIAERCLIRLPGARPTPAELLSVIGPVPATTRPWPEAVERLTVRQRWQLSSLLGDAGVTDEAARTLVDPAPPSVFDRAAPPSFEQASPTWVVQSGPSVPPALPPQSAPSPAAPVTSAPASAPPVTAVPYGSPTAPQYQAAQGYPPGYPNQYQSQPVTPGWVGPPPVVPQRGGGGAAAGIAVIAGIVAVALIGAVVWIMSSSGDDEPDPEESVAAGGDTTEPDPDPETSGEWAVLYEDYAVSLTTTFDENSTCLYPMVDFDDTHTTGSIYTESLTSTDANSYTDLVMDPCDIDYDTNTGLSGRLYSSGSAYGTLFDADSGVTVDECWAEIDANHPALDVSYDPWSPEDAPLAAGMTLCMYTGSAEVVLAEISSISPETSGNWMSLSFNVSVWY